MVVDNPLINLIKPLLSGGLPRYVSFQLLSWVSEPSALYNVESPLVYESMLLIYLAATLHVLALFATGNVSAIIFFGQLYL